MKVTSKGKRNLIIIVSAITVVVLVLLCVIIWQTVKVNKLKSEINDLDTKIVETNAELELKESKVKYFESEQYQEDYKKYELGYCKSKYQNINDSWFDFIFKNTN